MKALNGSRIVVRDLRHDDLRAFVAYRREPTIARYQSWSTAYDLSMAEALLADIEADRSASDGLAPTPGHWRQVAIVDRETDELVGDAAVHTLTDQPDTYELGVTLAPAHHGQGLATEALRLVIDALFADGGAHRVIAHADERNGPVHHALEAVGLRLEGRFVEADWFKDAWTSLRLYAVLASEWPPSAGPSGPS